MSMITDLHAYVIDHQSFSDLCGSGALARLYPGSIPQNDTLPAVCYNRAGGGYREFAHDGPSNLEVVRLQFDVIADDYSDLDAVREALKDVLDGYRGGMGSTQFQFIRCVNAIDIFDPITKNFHQAVDFEIWHSVN